jgi:pyruvate dehydrogenase E1 component alpha subunit
MGAVPIVGSTIPIAVGSAFASHYSKDSAVTAVFFGEGAREEGVFHESMNFAALHKLPVLFVCENNLYSVYTPLNARQPERYDSVAHAWSYGINAFRGDGNDGDAVYRMAAESVSRIRKGGGPEYLEFATYRWREHCGPNYDNDIGYRTEDEFKAWETLCPLRTLKDTLIRDGLLTDDGVAEWERDITGEIDRAFSRARQSPFPSLDGLANRVYSGQRNGG